MSVPDDPALSENMRVGVQQARLYAQGWQRTGLSLAALLAAAAAVALGLTDQPDTALRIASGALGLVLIATAIRLLVNRSHPGRRLIVALAAVAITLHALEILSDVTVDLLPESTRQGLTFVLSIAVCLLVSLVVLVRRPNAQWSAFVGQSATEAILISSALTLAAWRWGFSQLHLADVPQLPLITLLVALDAAVVGLALIAVTLDLDTGMTRVAAAIAVISVADALAMYQVATGSLPWPARILGLCGAVILVHGLDMIAPFRKTGPDESMAGYESRRILITTISLAAAFLALAQISFKAGLDTLTIILATLFPLMLAMRDGVQGRRFRRYLLHMTSLARRDPLTGLPNRRALGDDLSDGLTGPVSVLVIDLDQFKAVNDLIGHSSGDAVLKAVAACLQRPRGPQRARAYRLGGDEFAVVMEALPRVAEAIALALIKDITSAANSVPGVARLGVGASVGVHHLLSPDRNQLGDAVVQSGHAMRAAKSQGKGRVNVFDERMQAGFRRRKLVEVRLREGLQDVVLEYQPIVETRTGRVAGYESLARWHDPELGRVEAGEFVDVAEHSGLIVELGDHLMSCAIRDLALTGCLAGGRFASVNVSALQLLMPGFAQRTLELLEGNGLSPADLLIEVTESRVIASDGIASDTMRELTGAGVRLAIDDFGAGSTSVGYLRRLPLAIVKIDRGLSVDLDQDGCAIVRGVNEMCRGLGLRTVLEGVETSEQLALARELDVHYVQGWRLGRSVPASDLAMATARIEADAGLSIW